MRKVKEGNVIYLVKERPDSMDLRCSSCGIVKNEDDIEVDERGLYKCKCGSSSFLPQCELEELM